MKKLIWVPTVCLGLLVSGCGTNNDGLQNYAANDYKNTRVNPYRNMNMYSNNGADVYRSHVNSLAPNTGHAYGDQRTYLLRSGTNIANNQAMHQYGSSYNQYAATNYGYGGSGNSNTVGINQYGVNGTGQTQSLYGRNQYSGVQSMSSGSATTRAGFAQSAKGQTVQTAHQVYVDRDLMASYIANLVQGIPYVNSSTVLVTDDHVYINVDTSVKNRGNGRNHLTALQNQVKKQALSVTPRYYKVKVSSDNGTKQRLLQVGQQNTNNTDHIERVLTNNRGNGGSQMTR